MNTAVKSERKTQGFTLVELLVVIAIIGILATIVVPNVVENMQKARVARALSEVKSAEQSLTSMLTDTGRTNFTEFLSPAGRTILNAIREDGFLTNNAANVRAVSRFYNEFFYSLLRQGRNASGPITNPGPSGGTVDITAILLPEIRQKLGTSYMDINFDPWNEQYNFWMGPQRTGAVIVRSYRIDPNAAFEPDDVEFSASDVYRYDATNKAALDAVLPGNPRVDNMPGFPAPAQRPVYVWSSGSNKQNDALLVPGTDTGIDNSGTPEFWGGGDDVNSWDSDAGWQRAPRS